MQSADEMLGDTCSQQTRGSVLVQVTARQDAGRHMQSADEMQGVVI